MVVVIVTVAMVIDGAYGGNQDKRGEQSSNGYRGGGELTWGRRSAVHCPREQ